MLIVDLFVSLLACRLGVYVGFVVMRALRRLLRRKKIAGICRRGKQEERRGAVGAD